MLSDPVKPKEYRLDPSTIESTEEYKIDTSKESHREKIGGGETELFVHIVPFQLNHSQEEHILPCQLPDKANYVDTNYRIGKRYNIHINYLKVVR